MLRLSLLCGVLSLLLIQVLGGNSVEKWRTKARAVCTAIPRQRFLGQTVAADYTLRDFDDAVSVGGCPVDLPRTSPVSSPYTVTAALTTLTEIKYWVCANLRKANAAGVQTYIDTRFYADLVGAIDTAQASLRLVARYVPTPIEDALNLVTISDAARVIRTQVAEVALRLPCFCRLLKVMGFPLKADRQHNSAMCHALLETKKPKGRAFANVHKAAIEEFWLPMLGAAQSVPEITLIREGTCGEANLDVSWEPAERLNWFDCAARYSVNGYEVYMAPTGLRFYHGSVRMEPMYLPTGMMWFGERTTASIYLDQPQPPSAVPLNPAVHSFRTTKNVFLVHLMNPENNILMVEALEARRSRLSLEHVTGFPGPLRRHSETAIDKPVFTELCKTWLPGIAGYADNYPAEGEILHPELLLCQTQDVIEALGIVPRVPRVEPVPAAVEPAEEPEPEVLVVHPGTVPAATTTVDQSLTLGVPQFE